MPSDPCVFFLTFRIIQAKSSFYSLNHSKEIHKLLTLQYWALNFSILKYFNIIKPFPRFHLQSPPLITELHKIETNKFVTIITTNYKRFKDNTKRFSFLHRAL